MPDVFPRCPGVISNFINQGLDSNSTSFREHHPQPESLHKQPGATEEPKANRLQWPPAPDAGSTANTAAEPGPGSTLGRCPPSTRVSMDEGEEIIKEVPQAWCSYSSSNSHCCCFSLSSILRLCHSRTRVPNWSVYQRVVTFLSILKNDILSV